jgi:dipeptidyl aminopeptidase/acylaminoacyl peptidase
MGPLIILPGTILAAGSILPVMHLFSRSFHLTFMALGLAGTLCASEVEDFELPLPSGLDVGGSLHLPADASAPVPAVLLISGSGRQDRNAAKFGGAYAPHQEWRDAFNAAGIAVLTFDEAGTGTSDGDWDRMSLSDLRDMAATVIAWAREHSSLNADQIYVLGHSEGGLIVSMLSLQDPELAGLIYSAGPGTGAREVLKYQTQRIAVEKSDDPDEQARIRARLEAIMEKRLAHTASLREGLDLDPLALARQAQSPALVLQGTADRKVLREQSEKLAAALREAGVTVELRQFEDVNHMMIRFAGDLRQATAADLTLAVDVKQTAVDWVLEQAK